MAKRVILLALAWCLTLAHLGAAEMGPRRVLLSGNSWVLSADGIRATVDLNFRKNQGFNQGVSGPAANFLTVSRAAPTTSYAVDTSGNWIGFAANTARITNAGLTVEEQRINSIRNNSMQGAVAGTPGTPPTNWVVGNQGTLTVNVVGTGTESGIDYVDLQVIGTTSTTFLSIAFDTGTAVSSSYGQTWTGDVFLKLQGGSFTNVSSIKNTVQSNTSGGSFISNGLSSALTINNAALGSQRFPVSYTIPDSTNASVQGVINISFNTAVSLNFTLRIGWPQLEQNPNVPATLATGAQTVVANGTSGCTGTTGTVSGGAGTAATVNVTSSGGVVTAIAEATPGSYSVFPPSPATLTGVTGCVGAVTATLVPANNSALAFATTPIRTINAAVTRNVDVTTLTTSPTNYGSSTSLFVQGSSSAPTTTGADSNAGIIYNTSSANAIVLYRDHGGGTARTDTTNNGSHVITVGSAWGQNTRGELATAVANTDQEIAFNGTLTAQGAPSGWPPASVPNTLQIGSNVGTASSWNGVIERIAVWPSYRVTNGGLQTLTGTVQ